MNCSLFIRSYRNDFDFLSYCLRSIQRFASGFTGITVVVPNGQEPPTGTAETVHRVHEQGDGYMLQQRDKLHADCFTESEFILVTDSDSIFLRPFSPECFIADCRKPIWLYTPYTSLDADAQKWKAVTEKAIKAPVEYEFMRRLPFCIPRWALIEMRAWFWRNHGMSVEQYIAAQPNKDFSEFNCIGAWLWTYHHDRIQWQNTEEEMGICYVHQSHSWGGLNPDLRKHLEAALA